MKKRGAFGDWRTVLVLGALFLFGLVLVSRLFALQVLDHGFYLALSRGQQNVSSVQTGERGDIFALDKNGTKYLLATDRQTPYAFATPSEVEDPERAAGDLSRILHLEPDKVLAQLERTDTLHAVLKKELSEQERAALKEAELPGVHLGERSTRLYPQDAFASHLLGFVNEEGQGQYGVEEYYDGQLRGREGLETLVRNPAGYLASLLRDTNGDGAELQLTIDYNAQAAAESLLAEAAERLGASGGLIAAADPANGNILALAVAPEFDPNAYGRVRDFSVFQNPAVQQVFEPGSVFKPITMASALDAGALTPDTAYEDRGIVEIGGRQVYNYDERVWGARTMTEVLQYSINTGAVFAESQLGHRNFIRYLEEFGIFSSAKVDLAGEVHSENREFKKGYEINYATASFGQGIEMTPLQLLQAYTAFARDGTMVRLRAAETGKAPEAKRVLSSKTASQITGMLVKVTEEGFGKASRVPGYYVAGKTGTAQVPWSALGMERSGYSDETVQSYIGYAPAFNPRFVVLVLLRNPVTRTAEYSAVPVFQEFAQYLLNYYEVPPDRQAG